MFVRLGTARLLASIVCPVSHKVRMMWKMINQVDRKAHRSKQKRTPQIASYYSKQDILVAEVVVCAWLDYKKSISQLPRKQPGLECFALRLHRLGNCTLKNSRTGTLAKFSTAYSAAIFRARLLDTLKAYLDSPARAIFYLFFLLCLVSSHFKHHCQCHNFSTCP